MFDPVKQMLAFIAALVTLVIAATFVRADAAELGLTVTNVTTVDYTNGPNFLSIQTPPASFVIEARRTPSSIDFFRYSPNAPDSISVSVNGSDYATGTDGNGDPIFQPVGPPVTAGGLVLDFSAPVRLVPTDAYYTGELILVRVTDEGQNGDPATIETLTAMLVSGVGDQITLQLYESGPNTGEFFAYVPTTNESSPVTDAILHISHEFPLTATYQDPFDATEVSTDVAGVDPFGRLFDTVTGDLIDGARVTIVDDATGIAAPVFGLDGVSAYPSTLITGSTVTDASGLVYDLAPGEFRFPIMFPGQYRLVIEPPGSYSLPSAATEESIAGLPNGPFTIIDASYLGVFTLDGTGDVSFDVPLDPRSELVVLKEASAQAGAVGDFIRYTISVENTGDNAAFLAIRDELPLGFRYQSGTARRDGAPIADSEIASNGTTLTFQLGASFAGDIVELTYVAEITSGAEMGDAVNRAFAINGAGAPISNVAQAAVFIREDLLRSRLTIAGRVVEGACDPNADWPRKIEGGEGVSNARLYMENGAYVLTDEDGLFHFEDVEARAHVVQLDTASLPEGYTPVQCEENTRFAGSAISQFVDAQGGSVWRANFYVQKSANAPEQIAVEDPDAPVSDLIEYREFDKAWLNKQSGETAWAYPQEGRTPSIRAVNLGVKHDATLRPTLLLNGKLVPPQHFSGREVGLTRKVALTRWRGVPLLDGENLFVAIISDRDGNEVGRIERRVNFVNDIDRATYLPERSTLFADGQSAPKIAVRLTDGAGRPVHTGRLVTVEIEPPYRAKDLERLEDSVPLNAPLSSQSVTPVGQDGVALIELEPTTETGNARIRVSLDNGREEEITAYLKPALREWIVVGLADGTLGMETARSGDPAVPKARDLLREGRVAVFAKGAVKGDWLITAAVDTAKKRGAQDDQLFEDIDPDARYPLYGDRSDQQFEAESRYPVYLKAEKGGFQALLGDYDTGLTDAKLGRYARRMSGVRTIYEGERFSFTGFAAETNQDFVRDEIAADGTSGAFRLTTRPIVRNSETITIEARDRFRPDIIVETTTLARYLDYDIDFQTGEILFRLPIPAANDALSHNVIVAEYETFAPVERNVTAGGRAAARFFGGRAEIGVTGVHEEGRPGATDSAGDLAAVDLVVDATETTELRLEYGYSRRDTETGREDGDALLAEVNHVSGDLSANAYYAETEAGFGLNNHQSSAVSGVRRYGLEANYRFDQFENEKTGRRGERFLTASAYREENLETGATRSLAEVGLRQDSDLTSGAVGLRYVVEEPETGETRKSLLAITELRQNFPKLGLSVHASHDQPISGKNGSTLFPKRTTVGFDQRLFDKVTLNVSHEIQDGENVSSANTIVGLTAEPWTGAQVTASTDMITQDSGQRIGATLGVDQQVQVSDKWSTSFGVSRREELKNDGVVNIQDDIVPDAAVSPLEDESSYTSAFIGAGYRSDLTTGTARFEMRKSALGQRYTSVLGAAREVSETLSFAGAARVEQENNDATPDRQTVDARLGMAWRPRGEGLIAFNRFDIKRDRTDGESHSWKAINNLALNAMINERTQISVNHGFKYAELTADGFVSSGVTQLLGAEARYDLTKWLDVGVRGSALYSHNAKTLDYSYGPSIGITPGKNIWLSAGWNFDGFVDDDFMAAEFTHSGPYIQLRIKFDQTSAKGLLDKISPSSVGNAVQ